MICSKCNSEIPNGAKFCTVCGAPAQAASAAPANKTFCVKCGVELKSGAKFCTTCGTPVSSAAAPAPTANVGNNSAVSLNKEPGANDLVAAMNSAASAPAPAPVPTPAAAVPAPAPVPTPAAAPSPVPTPEATPAPGYNNGFSAPGAAPAAPEMPSFAPTTGAPSMGGDVNGLNGAAAAVAAAVPAAAKKSPVGKIILVIVIVLVLLLGGAAAFFFTNKAAFLSTFMGKPKYAAMVEKESFKKVTEQIDADALANQIKSISSAVSTLANANLDLDDMLPPSLDLGSRASADPKTVKLMSSLPISEGVDIKAMIKGYNEYLKSSYGVSRISGSISANIELGSELTGSSLAGNDAAQILDVLNGAKITYDLAASENMFGTELGVDLNGNPINVRMIAQDDGTVYLVLPFASETGFMVKLPTTESSAVEEQSNAALELESEEITRLLEEVVDIYTDHIKSSSVTMEKGSLVVAGRSVEGKVMVADINGKNLEDMLKAIFEHIANDKYFCDKIVNYIQSFNPDFTEADYKNAITDAVNGMNGFTEDQKLIVTTIIDSSGKPYAKSFALSNKGSQVAEIAFASNDTESDLEVKAQGSTVLTSVTKKTSEKDGTTTITVGVGTNESLGLTINFSGVDKAVFGKNETAVGTYSISFDTSNVKTALDSETIDVLKGLKLEFSNSVSGSTATSSISLAATDYISLKLDMSVTLSDDISKYKAPADFFDIEALSNGDIDSATEQKLKDYANSLIDGVVKATSGTSIGDLVGSYANDLKSVVNVDKEALQGISDLEDQVFDYYTEVNGWIRDCNVYSGKAYEDAYAFTERIYEFDEKLWDMMDTCTSEQLAALKSEFAGIAQSGASIKAALEAAAADNNPGSDPIDPGMSGGSGDPYDEGGFNDDWGFDDDWGFGDDER